MAVANLKAREPVTERFVTTLQGASDRDAHRHAPLMPWMHLVNLYLEHLGFVPGRRVNFIADYRSGNLIISPDHG